MDYCYGWRGSEDVEKTRDKLVCWVMVGRGEQIKELGDLGIWLLLKPLGPCSEL